MPVSRDSELGLARQLNRLLRERRLTIAVAEGGTGGRIGERLVRHPGATAYFRGGIVTYDYRSRTSLLDIPQELLQRHGAVSEEAAAAMARSVRALYDADVGLAGSGTAGPTGRTVGLLCLAISADAGTRTQRHLLPRGSRGALHAEFTRLALLMLRDHITREER